MQNNSEAFYTSFNALANAGKFNFTELWNLLSRNPRADVTWEDAVLLQTIVSNITLGRQMVPTLTDAIIAERRRDRLNSLMFSIGKMELRSEQRGEERDVQIQVLDQGGVIGSFPVTLSTPSPADNWQMKRIGTQLKVYSIEDTIFTSDDLDELKALHAKGERFQSYTIFDNVKETVQLRDVGHKLLQDLVYQIDEYAGNSEQELYQKFYSYADALLTLHDSYRCSIDYWQESECRMMLEIEIREPKEGARYGGDLITSYKRLLKKDGL